MQELLPESKHEREERILAPFSLEQRTVITERLEILSVLAYFFGKDFSIPVELNEVGQGWHWDFQNNIIRADPKDLLEKPMDYLRFVISHEGIHRRVSRTDFIPLEQWQSPGFSFLMNAIEDPRVNNFGAENDPKFRERMALAYQEDIDFEAKSKEKAAQKLGYQPRFMQAGFEYIKQWFKETQKKKFELTSELPEEVGKVVTSTLDSAQDAWWRYPSRAEADTGEEEIVAYAKVSYEIILEELWPEFKKLVEADKEDQKLAEFLNGLQAKQQGPKTEAESNGEKPKPVPLDSLSPEEKKQLQEAMDALPEDKKKELADKAEKALGEFGKELAKGLEGKLTENPEEKKGREDREASERKGEEPSSEKPSDARPESTSPKLPSRKKRHADIKKLREELDEIAARDEGLYEKIRTETAPLIEQLENDLRAIFRERKKQKRETGKRSGFTINIRKRISELAKGIHPALSRAWEKREAPEAKDYAFTILNDLSGSMQGEKIVEDFKGKVVITEVLSRLAINFEILGFNDRIYEYKKFKQPLTDDLRKKIESLPTEVKKPAARWNDDGWAIKTAAGRLAKQREKERILVVISDGMPEESEAHAGEEYELGQVVKTIRRKGDIKLAGLGLGPGTEHVSRYYPNSMANIQVNEMAERLAHFIRDLIENYDKIA